MDHLENLLVRVLRGALWGKPLPMTELATADFRQLFGLAEKQACSGIVCKALLEQGMLLDKYNAAYVLMTLEQVVQTNQLVTRGLHSLAALLTDHDIPFFVVKGQLVATSYLHPDCRMAGDVDFYVPPSHFEQARRVLIETWKVTFDEGDDDDEQHISFSHDEVAFEMHYTLMKFYSRSNRNRLESFLAEDMQRLKPYQVGDMPIPGLPVVDNLFYTFLHLIHHLTELGIGLRQFCDMACLMHIHRWSDGERERLRTLLRCFGYYRGFQAVCAVCVDILGLEEKYLPFPLDTSVRRYLPRIMKVVFDGGNFGLYGVRCAVRSGWRYDVEALQGKLRRYGMFYGLSPKEIRACFFLELPRKMWQSVKRMTTQL